MPFPIDRKNDRTLAPDFTGEVITCDIDRTYLMTRFSTLRGLARVPFETAVDKQDIEGMVPLLRELRRGPGPTSRLTPLYFLSASPVRLRPVLERKMLFDGLEPDGTTFKDWGAIIRGGHLRRLRDQVGFKLLALLQARSEMPCGASEILMGDDLETDPLAFTLYADILAGRLPARTLEGQLAGHDVAERDIRAIVDLIPRAPCAGVRRILIRLERHPAHSFMGVHPNLISGRGAFELSLPLWNQGGIHRDGVLRVVSALIARGMKADDLDRRLQDASRRNLLAPALARELGDALLAAGFLHDPPMLPDPEPAWCREPPEDQPWSSALS